MWKMNDKHMGGKRMRCSLFLISILIAVTGCASPEPCSAQSVSYLNEVDILLDNMNAALIYTDVGVDELIEAYEEALEEAQTLNPPRCARAVQTHLVRFLELSIDIGKFEASGAGDPNYLRDTSNEWSSAFAFYLEARGRIEYPIDE